MATRIRSDLQIADMNGGRTFEPAAVRINADGSETRTRTQSGINQLLTPAPPPPSDTFQGRDVAAQQLVNDIVQDPEKSTKRPAPTTGGQAFAPAAQMMQAQGRQPVRQIARRGGVGRVKLVQLKTENKNTLSWDF